MNNEIIEMLKKALEESGVICGGGIIASEPKPQTANIDMIKYLTKNYKQHDTIREVLILELMPTGKFMRPKEISEYIKNTFCLKIPYQAIFCALNNRQGIKRITKQEPIEYSYHDDYKDQEVTVKKNQCVAYFMKKN